MNAAGRGMPMFGAGGPAPPLSKRVFDKYDHDKSGDISVTEFGNLCYEMGHFLSPAEIEMAVRRLDTYVASLSI